MKNLNPCPICGAKGKFKCENCGARTHAFGKIDNVINAWQLGQVY